MPETDQKIHGELEEAVRLLHRRIEEILVELNRALRALNFYPPNHPALKLVLGKAYQVFQNILAEHPEITLSNTSQGFFFGEAQIGEENDVLSQMANEFFTRRIRTTSFQKDLKEGEFLSFLELLNMDKVDLEKRGGIEQLFNEKGIRNVWINEIHYEKFLEKQEEVSETAKDVKKSLEKQEEVLEEEKTQRKVIRENIEAGFLDRVLIEKAKEEDEEEKTLLPEEEEAIALLLKLENEDNVEEYNIIVDRIVELITELLKRNRFEVLEISIQTLMKESQKETLPEPIRTKALDGLRKISQAKTIELLLDHFMRERAIDHQEIHRTFLAIGKPAVGPLIKNFIDRNDQNVRSHISQVLIKLGDTALPKVEDTLGDKRSFVVRQMVNIVGEIGSKRSVKSLRKTLFHVDGDVRNETINSLAKIAGDQSIKLLISGLSMKDKETQINIIKKLAESKEFSAVKPLTELLQTSRILPGDTAVKKEVITALAKIGSSEASSGLARLLHTKPLIPWKRLKELRAFAAKALGTLGDTAALKALIEGTEINDTYVREKCWEALAELEHMAHH